MSNNKKLEKFLSLVLRHNPEKLGIKLDRNGFTSLSGLIHSLQSTEQFKHVTESDVKNIVFNSNKKRFSIVVGGNKIRANQGHTIPNVDLVWDKSTPDQQFLYHGTALKNLALIIQTGISRQKRVIFPRCHRLGS